MPLVLVALAVLAAGALVIAQTPAFAQEQGGGWSLRDLLFPRRRERVEPPPMEIEKPKKKTRSKPVTHKAEPQVPLVEKAPDARTVLVIGDFMASGLAEGLEAVFAQNPAIRIVDRAKGSSGLVRDDFYDWPASIKEVLESEKPVAVIAMIGSNDRQSMQVGDNREPPRTDAWTKQYEQRAESLGTFLAWKPARPVVEWSATKPRDNEESPA